ncbi:Fatty acyl-CoA reductase 2 [Acorus gramineus]|uniref:Fatty acyl-CoA reductase n=1 Tax=Acorus gramineus TaxID=55184 RepID=A0AAV9A4D2_ACOGR|nr:Fatty acyl-CoA reductase 2 [Acorus gramineus]
MGSLSPNSLFFGPPRLTCSSERHLLCSIGDGFSWKKKKKVVMCCHSVKEKAKRRSAFPINGVAQDEIMMKNLKSNGDVVAESNGGIGIVSFLKGKHLFITGATGFLAKVLVEKILRTVPDVGKIFLLIKANSNEAAMERLKSEIVASELFKCLEEMHGNDYQSFMLNKLVPVVGNVREDGLGIESDVADKIANEVDIIINSAANTTFDERYDVALDVNTRGPMRLMCFAKQCEKLKLFLQVSTAYVNGERQGKIMEMPFCMGDSIAREKAVSESSMISHPSLDADAEMQLVSNSTNASQDSSVAQQMKELGLKRAKMHGWQDTYVFTKAMGEMVINNMRGDIPVVTVRPSVIESTFKEPFPGWMEGNRMMDPIILCYGKGQLSGFLADPNGVLDVVPVDMVVNATLAAMAKHGSVGKPGMNVYHIASSVVNPLVFKDLSRFLFEHFESSPYMDSKGRPIHVSRMKLFHDMDDFSSYILSDAMERTNRLSKAASHEKVSERIKNMCMKSIEQAKYLADIYEPYTFYSGRFDNTNTETLMKEMSEEERSGFGFNVRGIDWEDYITNVHINGLRQHVMKGRGMCINSLSSSISTT